MKEAIKNFLPTAEAIQRLLYPHTEVIVHDILKNEIVEIYHSFSKRKVGDSSLLSKEEIAIPTGWKEQRLLLPGLIRKIRLSWFRMSFVMHDIALQRSPKEFAVLSHLMN